MIVEVFYSFHHKNLYCRFDVEDFYFKFDVEDCWLFFILFILRIYSADLILRISISKFDVDDFFSELFNQRLLQDVRLEALKVLFQNNFQIFNAQATRYALSSTFHQFCQPKSSFFMRETAVKWISFFLEFLMLYEVYTNAKIEL